MTYPADTDTLRAPDGAQPALPFAEDELATNGPRLRPSELARLLGVSRQSVSEWIKAGKVKLGSDGRLDPRKAVADVLRAGDPARLRARVLAPFAAEIAALRARVAHLAHELAVCKREREYYERLSNELWSQLDEAEALTLSLPGISDEVRAALMGAMNPDESEKKKSPELEELDALLENSLSRLPALDGAEFGGEIKDSDEA